MSAIERPDVLVIGAGVIGASCAFHLAGRGLSVAIIDRASSIGEGSTGRATGGFRATYGTTINVQLSLLAQARLAVFPQETGVDPGFRPVGYLWLGSAAVMDGLAAAVAVQRAAGLSTSRLVSRDEARALNPAVSVEGAAGGVFGASDGVMRPLAILEGYLEAARRLGCELHLGEQVETVVRATSGVATEVRTSRTLYQPGVVVNAAGAWAAEVAARFGVSLPVRPEKRQVACTLPTSAVPATTPLTIWADDGFHFRERDGRVLLLQPPVETPADPLDLSVEPRWLASVAARARERIPALHDVPLDPAAAWAGLYEVSPDGHAVFGRARECENLVLVNGSSGHGVMHAPALGLLTAELVADGACRSLDVSALRPTRFSEGAAVRGPAWL